MVIPVTTDRSRRLNKRMDDLFPEESGTCRVCGEPASGRRTRYCSERCSDIAAAVQSMFTWSSVRRRILSRDDHTCQADGCEACLPDESVELHVDHIRPVSEDGHPLDERNLITLCGECHDSKTHGDAVFTSEDAPGLKVESHPEDVTLADYLDG